MKLVPIRPPGSNGRKARAYDADILQLREQGYTFEAIREALAAAGVDVSNSTVQREVARAAGHQQPTMEPAGASTTFKACASPSPRSERHSATPSTGTARPELNLADQAAVVEINQTPKGGDAPECPAQPPSPSSGKEGPSSFIDGPRGEDVAKAFMSTQITNPFMRAKEQR